MLTVEDIGELIALTLRDMPPDLKRLYDKAVRMNETEAIHRRLKMLTTGKMIYTIKHDANTLPILKHLDLRSLTALAISGGVILWVYRGMVLLIPVARIANLVRMAEGAPKNFMTKTATVKIEFTTDDAIMLPEKIANALLGDEK